jgi:hypothetical protein
MNLFLLRAKCVLATALLSCTCMLHGQEFESLMGEETALSQYVQTQEDEEGLHRYAALFEKNRALQPLCSIPNVLHLVWLGPKEFPQDSVARLEGWMAAYPGWKVKLWIDVDREMPHRQVEKAFVQDFPFRFLEECFYLSDNEGEKSEVLRYEILFQEGGLYIDHDMEALRSLQEIHQSYDFYCGLDTLGPSILSSSVFPSTALIASRPGHPVIEQAMHWLKENWQRLEESYPGQDAASLVNRVRHRSFSALDEGVREKIDCGNRDIVFPTNYFHAPDKKSAHMAYHHRLRSWVGSDSGVQKKMERQLSEIDKMNRRILMSMGIIAGVGVALAVCLRRKRV